MRRQPEPTSALQKTAEKHLSTESKMCNKSNAVVTEDYRRQTEYIAFLPLTMIDFLG